MPQISWQSEELVLQAVVASPIVIAEVRPPAAEVLPPANTLHIVQQTAYRALLLSSAVFLSSLPNLISITFCAGVVYGFTRNEEASSAVNKIEEIWRNSQARYGAKLSWVAPIVAAPLFYWEFTNLVHPAAFALGTYLGQKWAQMANTLPEPRPTAQIPRIVSISLDIFGTLILYKVHANIFVLSFTFGLIWPEKTAQTIQKIEKLWGNKKEIFIQSPVSTTTFTLQASLPLVTWSFFGATATLAAKQGMRFSKWTSTLNCRFVEMNQKLKNLQLKVLECCATTRQQLTRITISKKVQNAALNVILVTGALIFSFYSSNTTCTFCAGIIYGFVCPTQQLPKWSANIGDLAKWSLPLAAIPYHFHEFITFIHPAAFIIGTCLGRKWAKMGESVSGTAALQEPQIGRTTQMQRIALLIIEGAAAIFFFKVQPKVFLLAFACRMAWPEAMDRAVERVRNLWRNRSGIFTRSPVLSSIFGFQASLPLLHCSFFSTTFLFTVNLERQLSQWIHSWDETGQNNPVGAS